MIVLKIKHQLGDLLLNVDTQLPKKGVTAVFGRSGAGKTSLINVLAGLTNPDEGEVSINGAIVYSSQERINTPIEKRNIGYVFQDARLFPHYSVKGNLLYGVKESDPSHFQSICNLLELNHLLDRKPFSLSGGEKQRVAIGRALLSKPALLLMDEPLASLDLPRKREVMPFLEKLAQDIQIPIVYVTHSLSEIIRLADHMLLLNNGMLEASGPLVSVWDSKAMRPWQSFSEQSTLFDATVKQHHDQYSLSQLMLCENRFLWVQKVDAECGASVRVQVRANDVSVCLTEPKDTSIRNVIRAEVGEIESQSPAPDRQSVSIRLLLNEECSLWCNITQWAADDLSLKVGDTVYAQVKGVSVTQRDVIQH
ncbi:molybdenum ABC transporter ATP-binding protein ModC [Vibrio nigripulchritudo]|uniref:molybdenum ABC transporter ATP-binding protein ModC n=1 Tax=Vibrio nigripulchritudo TaxID=28173 RepID=UPI0005FA3E36|nr:molybdenum ABC transporter ATP-binding protein ModC [Vibrio nigripulchritudo]KJY76375.1 molybdate transporter ATP-binding protein [Vibrio nigripulchritudo]